MKKEKDKKSKRYKVLVSARQYVDKHEAQRFIGAVKNSILSNALDLTSEEIASHCVNGYVMAFCEAEPKGRTNTLRKECWVRQQIYALDFDNSMGGKKPPEGKYLNIEEAIKKAKDNGIPPAFIYTTSSHTQDWNRYRMVFIMDRPILNPEEHESLYLALCDKFEVGGFNPTDLSCRERSRVFYPGKDIVYHDYDAIVKADLILDSYSKKENKVAARKRPAPDPTTSSSNEVKGELGAKTAARSPSLRSVSRPAPDPTTTLLIRFLESAKQDIQLLKKNHKKSNFALKAAQTLENTGVETYVSNIAELILCFKSLYKFRNNTKQAAKPHHISDPSLFYQFLSSLSLVKLFGLVPNKKFCCILPDHEDSDPSACIKEVDKESYYTCYGCDAHYNLFNLVMAYTGCSHSYAVRFFELLFNVSITTPWQEEQREEHNWCRRYLLQTAQQEHPELMKYLTNRKLLSFLDFLYGYSNAYVLDKDFSGDNKPIFYATSNQLSAAYGYISGNFKDQDTILRYLTQLAYLGFVHPLRNEEIPTVLLRYFNSLRKTNKYSKRIGCYCMNLNIELALNNAEQAIKRNKANNVRVSGLTQNMMKLTYGNETAKSIYSQFNGELNDNIKKFYKAYVSAANKLLDKKGWFTEQELIGRIHLKCLKKYYSAQCMPALLHDLNLERVSFTKEIEAKFNVVVNRGCKKLYYGASKIIIPKL